MTTLGFRRRPAVVEVRSHAWAQSVDAPAAWAQKHRWLLEAAFALFDQTGEWPSIEMVQRGLVHDPERAVAVEQLMVEIPPELGARYTRQVHLTVRGLAHVPAASELLDLFVRAMLGAVELTQHPDRSVGPDANEIGHFDRPAGGSACGHAHRGGRLEMRV